MKKRKKRKYHKSIWTNPDGFSIVDLLAIGFSSVFLYVALVILITGDTIGNRLELLRTLGQPVAIILGGYFGDQIAQRFGSKQRTEYDYNSYRQPGGEEQDA